MNIIANTIKLPPETVFVETVRDFGGIEIFSISSKLSVTAFINMSVFAIFG